MDEIIKVSKRYLQLRGQVLNYTNRDMNLELENDTQVYIAVFDIPVKSSIVGFHTQTLALVFGLNVHIYGGSGNAITGIEKNADVMHAMQSLFISCPQILDRMKLTSDVDYYESKNIRAYLKTRRGTYFKELSGETKEEKFLLMLMENVISKLPDGLVE